ncbi:MAG: prolyl oligopeptidase family serine peptidase [Balneolaceae bacterium]
MMKKLPIALALLCSLPVLAQAQAGLDTLSLKTIFDEPLLAGNRPGFVTFSPAENHLYYEANDSSLIDNKTYRVSLRGEHRREASDDFEAGFSVSPDKQHIVYSKEDDLWLADTDFSNKRRLTKSGKNEYGPHWASDSKRIAYVQDGDVWIINTEDVSITQVTEKKEEDPGYSIVDWAGENKLILRQQDTSDYEEYYFPEYVDRYVKPGTTRRGVPKQVVTVADLDTARVDTLYEGEGYAGSSVSASGRYVAVDHLDGPMKNRDITVYDLAGQDEDEFAVFEDSTRGWIYGQHIDFAPEGDRLMFQSEQDGWNHIYTVNPDGSDLEQHTEGAFDIPWVEWTDGNTLLFASNEVDYGERHMYRLNLNGNEIEKLTEEAGYRQSFQLSRDKQNLVYQKTFFNEPFELYRLNLRNPDREYRLTETIPERFKEVDWQQEEYVRFTGRDGETELSMSILEPFEIEEGREYPVVVFVHGAGSLQNVYKGWSNNYYREYMFHQCLNIRDYYVIEVDYRHSTGYGREFREDVTGWMGKYETKDIEDGLSYLADNHSQADTTRVGIYGGSYGGFMALYATSVSPEHFDAAAALRAVTNWENYYHTNPWYTWPRLGTPEEDSTNFARSSPLTYVDELEKPVLILHGLIDDNVGFQDAAQYVDELIQTGHKEFDMMMYPSERHAFEDPDAWYDEYRRIFNFFEAHLKEED